MSIQCGSLWEPHNDQAEIMYLENFHLGSPHDFAIRTDPNLQIGNIKQIYCEHANHETKKEKGVTDHKDKLLAR